MVVQSDPQKYHDNTARRPRVLLIFPPKCETALEGPHLAVPQLIAVLRSEGFSADGLDLNIRFFQQFSSNGLFRNALAMLETRREELSGKDYLNEMEMNLLLVLSDLPYRKQVVEKIMLRGRIEKKKDFLACWSLIQEDASSYPLQFDEVLHHVGFPKADVIQDFYDSVQLKKVLEGIDIVGISVAFHLQLYPALALAKRIRRLSPQRIIILGGSQISLMSERQKERLALLDCIDAVVVHEGEVPLLCLCNALMDKPKITALSSIPNAYVATDGQVTSPTFTRPMSMQELPTPVFNEHELCLYLEPRNLPVYISKGCYWGKCKFCDYTKLYTPGQAKTTAWAVFRPPQLVCTDLITLSDSHNIDDFSLISDAISPSYYRRFAEEVIATGRTYTFWSYCRVERGYSFEHFNKLYEAGVRALTFGVESTHNRILELIQKGNKVKDIISTIRLAKAAGIEVQFNIIPDYPTITFEEVKESIAFIQQYIEYIDVLNYQYFGLSANSAIATEGKEHGLKIEADTLVATEHGLHALGFQRSEGLTPAQHRRVQREFDRLRSEIAAHKRSRAHIGMLGHGYQNMNNAMFVLADDVWLFSIPFNPGEPMGEKEGSYRYRRVDGDVNMLGCRGVKEYLICSPGIKLIVECARIHGVFSVADVCDVVGEKYGEKYIDYVHDDISECIKTLIIKGFVSKVFIEGRGGRLGLGTPDLENDEAQKRCQMLQ